MISGHIVEGEYYCDKCKNTISEVSRNIADEFVMDENNEYIFDILIKSYDENLNKSGGKNDKSGYKSYDPIYEKDYHYLFLKYKINI